MQNNPNIQQSTEVLNTLVSVKKSASYAGESQQNFKNSINLFKARNQLSKNLLLQEHDINQINLLS